MRIKSLFLLPALIAVLNLIPAGRVTAQTFTTLHSFTATCGNGCPNNDGHGPYAGLITNLSGNILYGTATYGGSSGVGTVFALHTDGTGFTTLHSFTALSGGTNTEGAYPTAGLVLSSNTLYGTAGQGGASGNGTVFKVTTNGTGFTILHSFTALSGGTNTDGARPLGLLLSGNTLYGAAGGGTSGHGTVFALNTDGTGFTNLYSFTASDGGGGPVWLISGNTLYGTGGGGSLNSGTVFALNTDGTGFTNLYNFTATSALYHTNSDGAAPRGLCLSGNTLYGTAVSGGINWTWCLACSAYSGNGTVFAVNTDGTGFTNLHSFTGNDGLSPLGGLIVSGNTLYGTTQQGGSSGWGTAFAVNTDGTGFTTLHSFTAISNPQTGHGANSDGALPQAGLILSGNTLYGTAWTGGSAGNGTVFSLSFRPQLTIIPYGTNVVLSWPTNVAGFDYTGYTLQSTTNLGSPVWSTNSPAPVVIAGQNTVTNPITGAQQFYRLFQGAKGTKL